MENSVVLSFKNAEAIYTYLSKKPFEEVEGLISILRNVTSLKDCKKKWAQEFDKQHKKEAIVTEKFELEPEISDKVVGVTTD